MSTNLQLRLRCAVLGASFLLFTPYDVPTTLVPPSPTSSRPTPICSQCKVRTQVQSASDGSTTSATTWLDHDGGDAYQGEISIVAHFGSAPDVQVYHDDDVTIANAQTVSFALDTEASWANATAVTVYLPTNE